MATNANTIATKQPNTSNETQSQAPASESILYQALPAQVVEDTASIDTYSNQSLQSVNTSTSDDSDTVRIYDFEKQETTTITRGNEDARLDRAALNASATQSKAGAHTSSKGSPKKDVGEKRQRPTALELDVEPANNSGKSSGAGVSGNTPITPSRGSTPVAFKFLQPKRKLIEPSQVLSFDEEEVETPSPPKEKPVIEEEVVHALPSVKALAQVFLLTSNKREPLEKRWLKKVKTTLESGKRSPTTPPVSPVPHRKLETAASLAEIAEDATIASDLSSLETDPSIPIEMEVGGSEIPIATASDAKPVQTNPPKSPTPGRSGFLKLKSNIAFFENLKFK